MQRMWDLGKWECIAAGEVRSFTRDVARTVRIEVNAPDVTQCYVTLEGEGGPTGKFLARVVGRDVLEFSVDGPFDFSADGELWFYTIDGADISVEKTDHESFARVMERRVRNPELEQMMYLARLNTERRLEQQARDFEKLLDARLAAERNARREAPAGRNDDPGTSASTGGGTSTATGADGEPPVAASADAGGDKPAPKK